MYDGIQPFIDGLFSGRTLAKVTPVAPLPTKVTSSSASPPGAIGARTQSTRASTRASPTTPTGSSIQPLQ